MTTKLQLHERVAPGASQIVIDSAGAVGGGSARFLRELKAYLDRTSAEATLLGLDQQLTPQWLVQRELKALGAAVKISLNNAGFIRAGGRRITLLRNILQFATQDEMDALGFTPSRRLKLQTPVIRHLASHSDVLVVPSTRMAQQVTAITPQLAAKLVVRFHPVASPDWAGDPPANPSDILVPIVPQPYKNLDRHISELLSAADSLEDAKQIRVVIPSTPDRLPGLSEDPRLCFIGPQSSEELEKWWRDSRAIFFPVEFESFGYALAESRVYGRSIIAQATDQNREIAAGALSQYRRGDEASLVRALGIALARTPDPDPAAFDPDDYFEWLLSGCP